MSEPTTTQVVPQNVLPKKRPLYRKVWPWIMLAVVVLISLGVWRTGGIIPFVLTIQCRFQGTNKGLVDEGPVFRCLQVAVDAGQDCFESSDCSSGICVPGINYRDILGASWHTQLLTEPKVSTDGYIVGQCGRFLDQHGYTTLNHKTLRKELDSPTMWSQDVIGGQIVQ
jgi:hypothetical protein